MILAAFLLATLLLAIAPASPRRLQLPMIVAATGLAVALPFLAAAQVPDPAADPNAFVSQLIAAISGGQWRAVVVLVAIGGVYLLRTVGMKIPGAVGAFLSSSRGGAALALAFALVSGLGAAVLGGTPITVKLVLDVLMLGFTAIGGWVGVRRLLGLDTATATAKVYELQPPGTPGAAAAELNRPPPAA